VLSFRGPFGSAPAMPSAGQIPWEGDLQAVRRYELMLVLRPDAPDERAAAVIDRTTRSVVASGGQIVKVAPWGRRRLAYPIERYREGSYHIVVFEAPAEAIVELERSLQITEDVLRYLVTRTIKPVKVRRDAAAAGEADDADPDLPSAEDEEDEDDDAVGRIDESESEAAPAAID
jgi:small subunit ribosomal protein S6